MWEWLENSMRTISHLMSIARRLNDELIDSTWVRERVNTLIIKLTKFEKTYSSNEGIILGYFVVVKGSDIKVIALTAYGEEEPRVEMVNIEEVVKNETSG
jgi:hypothetical protein